MKRFHLAVAALSLLAQPALAATKQRWQAQAIKNVVCVLTVDAWEGPLGTHVMFMVPAPSQGSGAPMTLSTHISDTGLEPPLPLDGFTVSVQSAAISAPLSLTEDSIHIHKSHSDELLRLYAALKRGEKMLIHAVSARRELNFPIEAAGSSEARATFEACVAETAPDFKIAELALL